MRSENKSAQIPGLALASEILEATVTDSAKGKVQVNLPIDFDIAGRTLVADDFLFVPEGDTTGVKRLNLLVTLRGQVTPLYFVATNSQGALQEEKILLHFANWNAPKKPVTPPQITQAEKPVPVKEETTASEVPEKEKLEPTKQPEKMAAVSNYRTPPQSLLTLAPYLTFQKLEVTDKGNGGSATFTSPMTFGIDAHASYRMGNGLEPGVYLNLLRSSFNQASAILGNSNNLTWATGAQCGYSIDAEHRFHVVGLFGYQREPFVRSETLTSTMLDTIGLGTLGLGGSYEFYRSTKWATGIELSAGTFLSRKTDAIVIRNGINAGARLFTHWDIGEYQMLGAFNFAGNRFNTSLSTQSRVYFNLELGVSFKNLGV